MRLREGHYDQVPWRLRQRLGFEALVHGDFAFAWACLSGKSMSMKVEKQTIMRRAVPVTKPRWGRFVFAMICFSVVNFASMMWAIESFGLGGFFVAWTFGIIAAILLPRGLR